MLNVPRADLIFNVPLVTAWLALEANAYSATVSHHSIGVSRRLNVLPVPEVTSVLKANAGEVVVQMVPLIPYVGVVSKMSVTRVDQIVSALLPIVLSAQVVSACSQETKDLLTSASPL